MLITLIKKGMKKRAIYSCRSSHSAWGFHINFMQGRYFKNGWWVPLLSCIRLHLFVGKESNFFYSNTKQDHRKFENLLGSDHIVEDMYSFAKCDYIYRTSCLHQCCGFLLRKCSSYRITDITKAPTLITTFSMVVNTFNSLRVSKKKCQKFLYHSKL